jgi:hypothetical protein
VAWWLYEETAAIARGDAIRLPALSTPVDFILDIINEY